MKGKAKNISKKKIILIILLLVISSGYYYFSNIRPIVTNLFAAEEVGRLAAKRGDVTICSKAIYFSPIGVTPRRLKTLCFISMATELQDDSVCENITGSRDRCYEKVALTKIAKRMAPVIDLLRKGYAIEDIRSGRDDRYPGGYFKVCDKVAIEDKKACHKWQRWPY